jgi:hypothetical protein
MGDEKYTNLCRRIHEHCRRQQWYGPHGGAIDHRGYFDAEGNLLVAETSAFVSFYLTIEVLDLLSSHNCTKSR